MTVSCLLVTVAFWRWSAHAARAGMFQTASERTCAPCPAHALSFPVKTEESFWTLSSDSELHVQLQKREAKHEQLVSASRSF